MLEVKKKISKNTNKNQEDEITQLQTEIKNSIKNLYISDQKKKKTIDEYAQLLTKEYAKLKQENNQLKIEMQKYRSYIEQLSQKTYRPNYQKPVRKRKYYYDQQGDDESEESDSYITEIRRGPKKQKRKRIIYEDEIDGLPEYEPDSPTEEEQEKEDQNYEIQKKSKGKQLKTVEKPKKKLKRHYKINKNVIFLLVLLFVISLKFKMQKAISNKIQLGETLNPLHDYGGVPSINDEGTLENLITKVDKVQGFIKTGKGDGDLSRYFANILPITRQAQIAGDLPRKAYGSITYSDKKQLEFVLDLTASTYTNYSTMEICLPLKFTKKSNKAQQMDANMITVNNFFEH